MIMLYVRRANEELFNQICGNGFQPKPNESSESVLAGYIGSEDLLAQIGREFALGKLYPRIKKGRDFYMYVEIDNNSAYLNGLILTPDPDDMIIHHIEGRTVDLSGYHYERLVDEGKSLFSGTFFETYDSPRIQKPTDRDSRLVIYLRIHLMSTSLG